MKTTLFDIENWREIGATLSRNRTRTLLTGFGIFWGVVMLALLMGGEKGLEQKLMSNFEGFATNCAIVAPSRRTISYRGINKGTGWTLTTDDVERLRQCMPELDALATTYSVDGVAASVGDKASVVNPMGVSADYTRVILPTIYEGRFINEADNSDARKVCVVGKKVAADLFGTASPVGEYLSLGGIYYRVVGVAGQTSQVGAKVDETVVIPISTMRRAYHLGDKAGNLIILAKDGVSPGALRPRMERMLFANHTIHPDDSNALMFFDISEQFEMLDNLFIGVTLLALFVGCGSLIAGIIGVGNIMWVIVKERTTEIGIRRAIGAKPRDIIIQILSEGMVLTAVAGVAGISLATAVLAVAAKLVGPGFALTFGQATGITLTFLVLGTFAGLIPAIKAMKIKPIEAINDK